MRKMLAVVVAVLSLAACGAETKCEEKVLSDGTVCLVCKSSDWGGSEGARRESSSVDCGEKGGAR